MAENKSNERDDSLDEGERSDLVTPQDADDATLADQIAAESDEAAEVEADADAKADALPAPRRRRTTAPVRKTASAKGEPTPKRDAKPAEDSSRSAITSPATFVRQSVGELKRVHWPTASQTRQYFWVVLVFVLFIMGFVAGLDLLFNLLVLKALG